MRSAVIAKLAAITTVGTVFAVSTPAMAGRCGGSLAIDAPTTLAEVSSRCNVSLAGLREANPGVDPANVRPGEHLAMPDEVTDYVGYIAPRPAPAQRSTNASAPQHIVATRAYHAPVVTDDDGFDQIIPVQDYRGDGARLGQRIRIRDVRITPNAPSWLTDSPTGGHYSVSGGLSYQKLSAQRIRNASWQPTATGSLKAFPLFSDAADENVLPARFTADPKITVSTTHPGYAQPIDIVAVVRETESVDQPKIKTFSLSGDIVDTYQGCLILRAKDDSMWRLAAAPPIGHMLGKTVTVWGTHATSEACNGGPAMLVNQAVFAEPWTDANTN